MARSRDMNSYSLQGENFGVAFENAIVDLLLAGTSTVLIGGGPSQAPHSPGSGPTMAPTAVSATTTGTPAPAGFPMTPIVAPASSPAAQDPQLYAKIEELLARGHRQEAAQLAAKNADWGLAMVIGSVCGTGIYQSIAKEYATSHFSPGTPLHLLSLLFSNQATEFLHHGGRQLFPNDANTSRTTSPAAVPSSKSGPNSKTRRNGAAPNTLTANWRRNLSAILSNKSSDWQQLATLLGSRILHDNRDFAGAHAVFLCAGKLPCRPPPKRGSAPTAANVLDSYSIIGVDSRQGRYALLNDCISIEAFRITEILEWIVLRWKANKAGATSSGSLLGSVGVPSVSVSGLGKSIGGLLGFGGSSSQPAAGSSAKEDSVPGNKAGQADGSRRPSHDGSKSGAASAASHSNPNAYTLRNEDIFEMQIALTYKKFRFAQVLADMGLLDAAGSYIDETERLIRQLNSEATGRIRATSHDSIDGPGGTGSGSGPIPKPNCFSSGFLKSVDEFVHRLNGTSMECI
jgi:hypothetical protein